MGWGILVAFGIGLSQLLLTWYAVHVSVSKHRIRHATIIGAVGFVGIALTVFGAIRSVASQKELIGRLEKLQTTNGEELALNYVPSVAVIYQDNRVNILNQGRTNLYLWGAIYGAGPVVVDKESRLIPPGTYYYLFAESLEKQMLAHLRNNQEGFTPCYAFITTQDSSKHTVKSLLIGKVTDGTLRIHTQTIAVVNGWVTN